jgi:hypothetical protein
MKPTTKDDIKRSVSTMLANMEAELYGYETVDVKTLWESFSLKDKAKWVWYNKITSKGAKIRKMVDEENQSNRAEALANMDEDSEDDPDYSYIQYPDLAMLSPKQVMRVTTKIKLNQPIEYIGLSLQIGDIREQK